MVLVELAQRVVQVPREFKEIRDLKDLLVKQDLSDLPEALVELERKVFRAIKALKD